MNRKKVVIVGGGTVSHVRNHLALCMPAYGQTARMLHELVSHDARWDSMAHCLMLTAMAGGGKALETNDDVAGWVDELVRDADAKVVFFNVALCDYDGYVAGPYGGLTQSGKYEPRLHSAEVAFSSNRTVVALSPAEKVVDRIRRERKDIFLVAFKTTCGAAEDEQYRAALGLLKRASCNLVLANDTKTRRNLIVTPEEARYHPTSDRTEALRQLVDMAWHRSQLSFTRSTVVAGEPVPWASPEVPASLRAVVDHCIARGAYKPFGGATVGHFACALSDTEFLTSVRKTNFNDLAKNGLVRVRTDGPDSVLAYGAKPSVGGQSQRLVFAQNPGYDCIVHFHCPIRPGSRVPRVSQREYECGSHQCGQNTASNLGEFVAGPVDGGPGEARLRAVYLEEHGPNVVFPRGTDPRLVIEFIEENFDLEGKTGGAVS